MVVLRRSAGMPSMNCRALLEMVVFLQGERASDRRRHASFESQKCSGMIPPRCVKPPYPIASNWIVYPSGIVLEPL